MPDPFSVATGVVGCIVPALHGTRLLLNDLQELKDAPKTIKRLIDDVDSVRAALELLHSINDVDLESLGEGVNYQSKATISGCTQACDFFRADLQKWTRHSEGGKLAWLDRTTIGFFKKEQVKAISDQLQICKLDINLIVSIANLHSSVRNSHLTEEIKMELSTRQAEVDSAIGVADRQLILWEERMKSMSLSDDDDEAGTSEQGKDEALRQLQEQGEALTASRKLLDELLAQAREEAVAKAAAGYQCDSTVSLSGNVTFGAGNKGMQTGHIAGGNFSGMRFGG